MDLLVFQKHSKVWYQKLFEMRPQIYTSMYQISKKLISGVIIFYHTFEVLLEHQQIHDIF